MPASSNNPHGQKARQRARDQLTHMQEGLGEDRFAWDADDGADHDYLFRPGRVLVRAGRDEQRFLRAYRARNDELGGGAPVRVQGDDDGDYQSDNDSLGVAVYELPRSRGTTAQDVVDSLSILETELGPGFLTPEHYLHLAATGNGRSCPATEPEETGREAAWPPARTDTRIGQGVEIVVLDMGYDIAQGRTPALKQYDGHGSFIEAIIESRAPGATIRRRAYPMSPGGAINERALADVLRRALEDFPSCSLVNLCAGCHTRRDQPLKAFERVWNEKLKGMKSTVLVCAAGNDGSYAPFYPAASPWAMGVGSLDRNGTVSSFSNFMESADVFVLGRNHINRFPKGTYVCMEAPDKGDERRFKNGWARWSGTSFATPLFTGMVAAHMTENNLSAPDAVKDLMRTKSRAGWDSVRGRHRMIGLEHYDTP